MLLTDADEQRHQWGDAENENESFYLNAVDHARRSGLLIRIAVRPNRDRAEVTTIFFQADGRAAFGFERVPAPAMPAIEAGGVAFTILEPLRRLQVAVDTEVLHLPEPSILADPRRAYSTCERTGVSAVLEVTGAGPCWGGVPEEGDRPHPRGTGVGHYEQLVEVKGLVKVGDHAWDFHGGGVRDHSWGPRTWQANRYYRWLTAPLPYLGIVALRSRPHGQPDGMQGGFVWDGDRQVELDTVRVRTTWREPLTPGRIELAAGAGASAWHASGRVLCSVPLRPEAPGALVRMSQSLVEWSIGDHTGCGIAEYLDEVTGGEPAGRVEDPVGKGAPGSVDV